MDVDTYVFSCVGCLEVGIVYGVGGLDDVTLVGDVHGWAFLWMEVHEPVRLPPS